MNDGALEMNVMKEGVGVSNRDSKSRVYLHVAGRETLCPALFEERYLGES